MLCITYDFINNRWIVLFEDSTSRETSILDYEIYVEQDLYNAIISIAEQYNITYNPDAIILHFIQGKFGFASLH